MTTVQPPIEGTALTLRLLPVIHLTDDQLYELCLINRELRIERTAEGELLIMPPTGSGTGHREAEIVAALVVWAKQDATGIAFGSSTGFTLPNGAMRSPDAAWVKRERWNALTEGQKEQFAPLCPDFVVELRSRTDSLSALQAKMQEYIDNGAALGWLIDPEHMRVYIYRPRAHVECLENPDKISADPLLPGFTLQLLDIWM